ncbi:MAG: hypothetical protein M3Q75_15165 [Gemmatimonadota bacterium]|nr:hypothetical protein [Gemmatimonadota bacterium]
MSAAHFALATVDDDGRQTGYLNRRGTFTLLNTRAARFTTAGDAAAFSHTHGQAKDSTAVICFTTQALALIEWNLVLTAQCRQEADRLALDTITPTEPTHAAYVS